MKREFNLDLGSRRIFIGLRLTSLNRLLTFLKTYSLILKPVCIPPTMSVMEKRMRKK